MHLRRRDIVQVVSGDDRGKRGRVLRVFQDSGRVIVEGVNYIYRHLKPNRQNPQGGRVQREAPVDGSNVSLVCKRCNRGVRVRVKELADGGKERVCVRCGEAIGGD